MFVRFRTLAELDRGPPVILFHQSRECAGVRKLHRNVVDLQPSARSAFDMSKRTLLEIDEVTPVCSTCSGSSRESKRPSSVDTTVLRDLAPGKVRIPT